MKAAIYKGIKQMACEERPKPGIVDGGDAIIRVVRACVCGSDLWFYRDVANPSTARLAMRPSASSKRSGRMSPSSSRAIL